MKNQILGASFRRLVIIAALWPAFTAFAQTDEVQHLPTYVTLATRTPQELTTTGSLVDKITADEMARMQLNSLRSALSSVPGAPAFASGAKGGITSLFLRGSNSNQTLFLVDGIRYNDPNTEYFGSLGGMCASACDSLEVAHGPQSTLYGGEAVGGVVSLRAQRGAGPAQQSVSVEAGSFGTVQGAVAAQGENGATAYNFSAIGGSTQNERANNDFKSATYALRLDRQVSKTVAVGATLRGFLGDYGSPGTRFTNDPDNNDEESNQLATLFAEFTPTPDFSSKVVLGGQDRRFVSTNPGAFGTQTTIVKNRRGVLDWQNTLQAGDQHRVTAGLTAEQNHTRNTGFGSINKRQALLAVFAQDEWTPVDRVYLTAGLRSDDHDTFGRKTTGRMTAAWLSKSDRWKLRSSYGTAFRSPSFLDLYGRSSFYFGNPNLRPETARGWDAGVDYFISEKKGMLSATWFETDYTDLIASTPSFTSVENIQRAHTEGLELSGKFTLLKAVQVRATYTYLEATNESQHIRLLRRPRQSGSLDVWRDFGGGFSVGAGLAVVVDRRDVHAKTFAMIAGEDYSVVRLYGAWQATKRVAVKARVENLLNEKYEEVHGYPQTGIGAFAGVEVKF